MHIVAAVTLFASIGAGIGAIDNKLSDVVVGSFYNAQTGKVVKHEVASLVFTESVKIIRIKEQGTTLACWSATIGRNTTIVTCG